MPTLSGLIHAEIVIALDGENPWAHFPEGGGRFLRELFWRLNDSWQEIVPTTLGAISGLSAVALLIYFPWFLRKSRGLPS